MILHLYSKEQFYFDEWTEPGMNMSQDKNYPHSDKQQSP